MARSFVVRGLAAVVVTLAFASIAIAGEGKETKMSQSIMFWGGSMPSLGGSTSAIPASLGLRYQFAFPFGQSHHWVAAPAIGYGYGRTKSEFTSAGTTTTSTTSAVTWDALLDFLYYNDCCDDDDFYCGPGVFYSSSKPKQDPPPLPGFDFAPYNTFGLQLNVGGGIPWGKKYEWVGSLTERFGMTMYDQKQSGNEDKLSGTTFSTQASGGLRIRF